MIKRPVKVSKEKVIITKNKIPKAPKKPTKPYAIGGIHINSFAMQEINNNKSSNELNKLAYMYSINKNSAITISTDDSASANRLKQYLQTQNVKKHDIKIITNENQNSLIKITLTGRK